MSMYQAYWIDCTEQCTLGFWQKDDLCRLRFRLRIWKGFHVAVFLHLYITINKAQ